MFGGNCWFLVDTVKLHLKEEIVNFWFILLSNINDDTQGKCLFKSNNNFIGSTWVSKGTLILKKRVLEIYDPFHWEKSIITNYPLKVISQWFQSFTSLCRG